MLHTNMDVSPSLTPTRSNPPIGTKQFKTGQGNVYSDLEPLHLSSFWVALKWVKL